MIADIITSLLKNGLNLVAGAVLTRGKEYVEELTGVELTPEPTDEQILSLKMYQMNYALELYKVQNVESAQVIGNTVNARDMYREAITKDNKVSLWFTCILAGLLALLSCVYVACITFIEIPPDNVRYVDTILGFILGTILASIINFYLGSSRSSQSKDNAIALLQQGDGL